MFLQTRFGGFFCFVRFSPETKLSSEVGWLPEIGSIHKRSHFDTNGQALGLGDFESINSESIAGGRTMIAVLRSRKPEDRKDPPKRLVYLCMVALAPCMALVALWNQGDLTLVTASLTLSVGAFLYVNLEAIQIYLRPAWAREYHAKLAPLTARLTCSGLSADERRQVLGRIQDLNDRYHLVTSPAITYMWVKRMAFSMACIARFLRASTH
jgi:hypothetical protein